MDRPATASFRRVDPHGRLDFGQSLYLTPLTAVRHVFGLLRNELGSHLLRTIFLHVIEIWIAVVTIPVSLVRASRRIELDSESLTLIPLLPLRRRRRLLFTQLAPFEIVHARKNRPAVLRAQLKADYVRRSFFRRPRYFNLSPIWSTGRHNRPLPLSELRALLERYRSKAIAAALEQPPPAYRSLVLSGK